MNALFRMVLLAALICGSCSVTTRAQTTTVIPFAEAPQHVGQHVTVEGVVVKVFTSRNGNTFLDFGAAYPNELFTGWIPPASPGLQFADSVRHRRKARQNYRTNRDVQREAGNSDQCSRTARG
jgi:hypothetical protein